MIQQRLWGIGLLGFIMVLSANSVSHGQDTPYVPYTEVWHLSEEFALDAVWKPDGTGAAYLSNLGIHIFDAQYNEQQVIELPLLVEWFYAALEWSSDGFW